jgi:hypothetical protein
VYPLAKSRSSLNPVSYVSSPSVSPCSFTDRCAVFSWRTTLSSTLFNTSPRRSIPSLHADLAFSLLTYAFALANLAHSSVLVLGAYEHERGISDTERKEKDEKLNFAVNLLCRASGIFTHIAENVLVEWDRLGSGMSSVSISTSRPPDLSRDVNNALAKCFTSV